MSNRRTKIVKKSDLQDFLPFIEKIYYINLEQRNERKESIIKEIKKIDHYLRKTERINAFYHKKGYIGCAKSHIFALEDALKNDYDNVLIFEDDFVFQISPDKVKGTLESFLKLFQSDYNLFLLGKNLRQTRKTIHPSFLEVIDGQTTSCYLINKKFIPDLLENFKCALENLEKGGHHTQYSIDVTWKKFQKQGGKIYTTDFKIGLQKPDYSDIEKRYVSYGC